MKTFILGCFILIWAFQAYSQDQASTYIKEAQDYLAKKDYKQAILSLQDAINDLNNGLAVQIANELPSEINGLKADGDAQVNNGSMGIMGGGMQIMRTYRHPSKHENEAELQIMANSPMMSTINMYMSNPAMLGQGYKSVRVGSQRAIMKTENEDYYDDNGNSKPIRSSELQIPLTQTLVMFHLKGFASEADELAFANKLDWAKLKTALGE